MSLDRLRFFDGQNDLYIDDVDEEMTPVFDKSTRVSSGGQLKSQTTGERIAFNVKFRLTPAQYREMMDFFKSGIDRFFFTPSETYEYLEDVVFPIECNITDFRRTWDNRHVYYISMRIESVDYI